MHPLLLLGIISFWSLVDFEGPEHLVVLEGGVSLATVCIAGLRVRELVVVRWRHCVAYLTGSDDAVVTAAFGLGIFRLVLPLRAQRTVFKIFLSNADLSRLTRPTA